MALVNCPKCGKEVTDQSIICGHCGYFLSNTETGEKCDFSRYSKNTSRVKAKRTAIVGGLLVTIIIMMLVVFVLNTIPHDAVATNVMASSNKNESVAREIIETTATSVLRFTEKETKRVFQEQYDKMHELVDDLKKILEYWNATDFTTINEIRELETMWRNMADEAESIETYFKVNSPAESFESLWIDYCRCWGEMEKQLASCSNLDIDGDGAYEGKEMKQAMENTRDNVVATMREAFDIIDEAANVLTEERSEGFKGIVCIECGNTALRYYKNPFSGKEEPYCESHYQEIIGIMSSMESDVGKSSQNKHTCEECRREGTHKYVGFTGQTEYYCTEHYEELKEMLKSFGLE